MPQIFHPSTNTFSKASIFGAVFIAAGVVAGLGLFFRSSWVSRVDVAVEQPVQFSHEHHVAGMGIDCRYCHTTVDESSFAGIPPLETCMTCHSQIWSDSPKLELVRESYRTGAALAWVRVHDLPDFVYFDHQVHVNNGVACETCHGQVNQMPLTWKEESLYMDWCLNCHRHPEQYLRPIEAAYEMGYQPAEDQATLGRKLIDEYQIPPPSRLDDCTTCHR